MESGIEGDGESEDVYVGSDDDEEDVDDDDEDDVDDDDENSLNGQDVGFLNASGEELRWAAEVLSTKIEIITREVRAEKGIPGTDIFDRADDILAGLGVPLELDEE